MAYKQRMKMGRFAEKAESPAAEKKEVNIPVGSRCEIETNEPGLHKRGTVRFVGETKFGSGGVWVGVEYDEPMGKKRKRGEKDPDAPKRPGSAYLLYQNRIRKEMKETHPNLTYKELLNEIGKSWAGMSDEDKKVRAVLVAGYPLNGQA